MTLSVLAVAATGGHLNELRQLIPRLSPAPDHVEWATFDTPQSRSLLAGQRMHFVRPTPTRDPVSVAANVRPAVRLLRSSRPDMVLSTGSGIALSFLPVAAALGIPAHYIESATRLTGPSMTGRALARVPRVRTYTQDRRWADGRWLYRGSVFDGFEPEPERAKAASSVRRVVVILGSNPYGFRRLLERLIAILPRGVETLWQTGVTDTDRLPIDAHRAWPARELHEAMAHADVVVAHAGIGAALSALEVGRIPVLVPRRQELGEQIDDHQMLVAQELAERGLAVTADADTLEMVMLERAAGLGAMTLADPPRFVLSP